LRKVWVFFAPVVIVAFATRGAPATCGIILEAAAFDDARKELFGPGDGVAPANNALSLKPLVALFGVIVDHPFAHIAVHVKQTPSVWLLWSDEVHSLAGIVEKPAIFAEQRRIAAERIRLRRAGAAGVFPFGFGRQSKIEPGDAADPFGVLLGGKLTHRYCR